MQASTVLFVSSGALLTRAVQQSLRDRFPGRVPTAVADSPDGQSTAGVGGLCQEETNVPERVRWNSTQGNLRSQLAVGIWRPPSRRRWRLRLAARQSRAQRPNEIEELLHATSHSATRRTDCNSVKRLESIGILARWGSRFRNASVPMPPYQFACSMLRKSRGESDAMQNWPPEPPGSLPGAIGALTRGSLAKPYRCFLTSAGRRQAIADIFFGLTIVAALRPDPIARCQQGQQRPTHSARGHRNWLGRSLRSWPTECPAAGICADCAEHRRAMRDDGTGHHLNRLKAPRRQGPNVRSRAGVSRPKSARKRS